MATINATPLKNVQTYNSFTFNSSWRITQGNTYNGNNALYLQLIDKDQSVGYSYNEIKAAQEQLYLRYLPTAASSPTLSLTFNDLDVNNVVTVIASQPFSNDGSIWSFNLTAAQTAVMNGGTVLCTYTEFGTSWTFYIKDGIFVQTTQIGMC